MWLCVEGCNLFLFNYAGYGFLGKDIECAIRGALTLRIDFKLEAGISWKGKGHKLNSLLKTDFQ